MAINNETSTLPIKDIIAQSKLKHIAIIMDGNRRWAKRHFLPSMSGHSAGVKALKNIINLSSDSGIEYLTVYAFSTENWGRKKEEVDFLMLLLGETIKKELAELHRNNVKIRIIGDLSSLNIELQNILIHSMEKTSENSGLRLQIAINYGARNEIVSAVRQIATEVQTGKLSAEEINENLISNYLYTSEIPDPELLIRTGGEQRLSNYLLWQLAYTEIYVTSILWPDFNKTEFEKAVMEFTKRERRFGKD